MRVFILSLLAVSSVHSHAIRYPYHGQLLSYSPARGEFPVYNEHQQGYVRYFDSNGAERLVSYNYPEPLYGVRRISYGGQGNQQLLRTYGAPESGFSAESYYQIQDTSELAKAREEHFRRWCEQRYQALKAEMDKLRAEGLKPSSDMMAQLQPLEKIISSTTYTAIAGETPEIQRIRDEHLRIWNEARLKVLQQEADHLRFSSGVRPVAGAELNTNLNGIIGETAEQKLAREEHLRLYNERLAKLKKVEDELKLLQGEHKYKPGNIDDFSAPKFELKTGYQQQLQWQQTNTPIAETPEVIKAREEHLRIYNEQLAKLKQLESEKTRYYIAGSEQTSNDAIIGETAEQKKAREEHLRLYNEQLAKVKELEATQKLQQGYKEEGHQTYGVQQLPDLALKFSYQPMTATAETPEVIRAREEHLRIYNEQVAKLKQMEAEKTRYYIAGSEQTTQLDNTVGIIGETAEQKKAREEHLRLYNEQLAKVKELEAAQKSQQGYQEGHQTYGVPQLSDLSLKTGYQQMTPVVDTPEVIKAREEHLRIYNEQLAKLKQLEADKTRYHYDVGEIIGETAEQKKAREEHLRIYNEQLTKVKQMEAEKNLKQGIWNTQTYGAQDFALKSSFQGATQQQTATTTIGDTPEVIRAREEHLRLVNEAKLRAQAEGSYNTNDDGSYKAEYHEGSSYKAEEKFEQTPILKFIPAIQQPVQPIQNIAIVQAAQPINQGIQQQQQAASLFKTATTTTEMQAQPTPVQDTPEVIRAREEHLKLVNEVKLKAMQTQEIKQQLTTTTENKAQIYTAAPLDDAEKLREEERLREEQRLMEAERLREAERMREEEKMREMERLREMERQKEEEKMLEVERLRLKQEEEQRMEMERLAAEKRLKEEQMKRISSTQGISTSGGIISGELLGNQLKTTQQQTGGLITGSTTGSITGATTGSGFVLSSEYQNNPYLIRFASQAGNTAYIIGDKQPVKPNLFYLPSAQKEAPLYLRYTTNGLKSPSAVQQLATATLTGGSAEKFSTYSSSSSASSSSSSGSSSSSNLKLSYGGSSTETSTGLSELEKATREHFRAHELALEQLRLANLKTPYKKDC